MLFGVYLLIRKGAVLRYIYRPHRERGKLLAVWVSLLAPKGQANMRALYHISSLISSRFEKNVRDTALDAGFSILDTGCLMLDCRWPNTSSQASCQPAIRIRATFLRIARTERLPSCLYRTINPRPSVRLRQCGVAHVLRQMQQIPIE